MRRFSDATQLSLTDHRSLVCRSGTLPGVTHHADIEGIAKEIHDRTGISAPVDAFRLAELLGFITRPWGRAYSQVSGREIRYPARVRSVRQHRQVAHEIAHPLLTRGGEDDRDEEAADRLALALMMPRYAFVNDLGETDWDLFAMMQRHENCSAQAIVVRMCMVSDAAASVYDQGSRTALYLGEGAHEDPRDDELADRALQLESLVRAGLSTAYPLIEGRYRRIVVVRRAA